MLWDTYKHFIEKISQEEDSEVHRTYAKDYLKLRFVTGLFWDLSTPRGRLLNLLHFVYTTSNFLFTTYVVAITTFKAVHWRMDVALIALIYLAATIYAYSIYLTTFLFRHHFALIHKDIGRNFFRYSFEIETNEEFIGWIPYKIKQYMFFVFTFLNILSVGVFVLIKLPVEERYVNGLYLTLPVPSYYPFVIDTWLDYLIALLSQIMGLSQAFNLTLYGLIVHMNIVMKIATQLQRLKDSVDQIDKRAFHLVKMFYGSVQLTEKYQKSEFELYIDDQFVSCLKICLKENFEHYKIIKKHYETWSRWYTAACLLAIALVATVAGGSAAIVTLDGAFLSLKFIGILQLIILALCGFALCGGGQLINDLSEDIFNSFYNLKWYAADRRLTSDLQIISLGVMTPIRPMLLHLVAIDFEAFCLLLRTTYSFYNFFMLRSLS